MKLTKVNVTRGILSAIIAFVFMQANSAEIKPPATVPVLAAVPLPKATKPPRPLPDLFVERVWLDDQDFVNFQLKNGGEGEIPESEHRQGMVRVTAGNILEDLPFVGAITGKTPIDPNGILRKPGGSIRYRTGIKLRERTAVTIVVDSLSKITEANEQNNSSTFVPSLLAESKTRDKAIPIVSEPGRDLLRRKEPKVESDEGRGGEGSFKTPRTFEPIPVPADLVIPHFYIIPPDIPHDGPTLPYGTEQASYNYRGSGYHQNIPMFFYVKNIGQTSYSGVITARVFSVSEPPSAPRLEVTKSSQYVSLPPGEDYFFSFVLNQQEMIGQGLLLPGRYRLRADFRSLPGGSEFNTTNNTSPNDVILNLNYQSETIVLSSEEALTASVAQSGSVFRNSLEVSSGGPTRGFVSFSLNPVLAKIQDWMREGWSRALVTAATLEIEQEGISVDLTEDSVWVQLGIAIETEGHRLPCDSSRPERLQRGHQAVGDILLDWLDYGSSLTASDYNAPMYTNLYTFSSACSVHVFPHMSTYIQHQIDRGGNRLQFRLRLRDEGKKVNDNSVTAFFKKQCRLILTLEPR